MHTDTVTPTFELRPYQVDAIARTHAAEARGVRKQLGVAATGLGKTIVFCALARERAARTLILVHRDELARQAAAKVREVWPDVDVGIVKAAENDIHAQVVIASVQTLARERRMDQLVDAYAPKDDWAMLGGVTAPFDLVIVDEAHHTVADSYQRILGRLNAGETDGPLLLGVTATPDRGDGKGLDDLFSEIVWNYDILWGIRSGYLCDVRGQRVVLTGLNLSDVKVRRGDYEAGSAGRALEAAQGPALIYRAWEEHAKDRRTLVFTPTVDTARLVAEVFQRQGVAAAWISGETDLEERRAILRGYSEGTIQVLANCMVLTEGYDEPRTDCIIQARPTKSRALFTQMIGRGTRKHPDKEDLLVLDVVGSSVEHSLVTVPSLLGVPKNFADRLGDGTGTLSDVAQEWDDQRVRAGQIRAEEADLFRKMRAEGGIAWIAVHHPGEPRRYERSLGKGDAAVVLNHWHDTDDEGWVCGLVDEAGVKRVLVADVSLEVAQGVGEDAVRKLGKRGLTAADAAWRKRRPTDSQKTFAASLGLPIEGKSAGEVSDAIDAHLARKRNRKRRRQTG